MRIDVYGFSFDPKTGEMFDPEGNLTPFTFDHEPGLNPMQFASRETAQEMALLVDQVTYAGTKIEVMEPGSWNGRMIRAIDGSARCELNAGLIANMVIRSGKRQAMAVVRMDLSRAGIGTRDPWPTGEAEPPRFK